VKLLSRSSKGNQPADEHLDAMTLMEHLRELRTRIIRSVIAVVVAAVAMWFVYPYIVDVLAKLLEQSCPSGAECRVMATNPIQSLSTRMTVSAYGGIGLALPVLLWQVWQFVTPGLYRKERRLAAPFVVSSFVLFLLGAALAWATLPKAIYFLARLGGDVDQFYAVNEYTAFVVKTAVGFGIGFQFPVLLVFLQIIGLVTYSQLAGWRRHALVVIIVGAAVITPGGDMFSLVALAVPMYLLFEVSIIIGWVRSRRRRRDGARGEPSGG
jgi:sec-independent protein translocase protein TatC